MTAKLTPATVRAHHSLTPEAIEQGAKALAVALNGGDWDRDYTDDQKALWRQRVMEKPDDPETHCRLSNVTLHTTLKGEQIHMHFDAIELDGPGATEFVAAIMRMMGEKK